MSINKSLEKQKENEVDQSASRPKTIEDALGSHYALQVALQTMKERCQNLQQRLGTVEEENVCLRLENLKLQAKLNTENSSTSNEPAKSTEELEEKVALLTRQKSQLTHHLFMVASENRQLWNRLSRLTQANQSLGSHLTKISDTLSRHSSSNNLVSTKCQSPTTNMLNNRKDSPQHTPSSSIFTLKDSSDFNKRSSLASSTEEKTSGLSKAPDTEESLEEISLKLIKSFLQEKTELEDQYAQMVEMQAGTSSSFNMHTLGFGYLEEGDEALEEMKKHRQSLIELRDLAQQQQRNIKSAIENMEKLKKDGSLCPQCQKRETSKSIPADEEIEHEMESLRQWGIPEGTSYTEDMRRQLDQVVEPPTVTSTVMPHLPPTPTMEDRICPLCGKCYSKSVPFRSFQSHVMEHFPEEDDEESSLSLINNFEVITQDT